MRPVVRQACAADFHFADEEDRGTPGDREKAHIGSPPADAVEVGDGLALRLKAKPALALCLSVETAVIGNEFAVRCHLFHT
jgi:hypothetical protein